MEFIIGITIHILIPLIGFLYFIHFRNRMKNENIQKAPTLELFVVFATYGALLIVVLTKLFWNWSGMASLGVFYLVLVAPIMMGVISYRNRKIKMNTKYHKWIYSSGILYFVVAPLVFLLLFLIGENY